MAGCSTGCTTIGDLIRRVSGQLNDQAEGAEFTTWSRETLVDYANEGLAQIAASRPDIFAETTSITLSPGSIQTVPEGYSALNKLDVNISATGAQAAKIAAGDEGFANVLRGKRCTANGCGPGAAQAVYEVKSYTKGSGKEFTVSPAVPAGQSPSVKASLVKIPPKFCVSKPDECLPIDTTYEAPLVEWMLFRAWGTDAEIAGAMQMAGMRLKNFFEMLGVQYRRESAFNSGYWKGNLPPEKTGDPNVQHWRA